MTEPECPDSRHLLRPCCGCRESVPLSVRGGWSATGFPPVTVFYAFRFHSRREHPLASFDPAPVPYAVPPRCLFSRSIFRANLSVPVLIPLPGILPAVGTIYPVGVCVNYMSFSNCLVPPLLSSNPLSLYHHGDTKSVIKRHQEGF